MAKLYVAEFAQASWVGTGLLHQIMAPAAPPIAAYTVDIGGTSAKGQDLNALTRFVQVSTDAICSVGFGAAAVATANRMAANETRYYGVNGGYISVITNS